VTFTGVHVVTHRYVPQVAVTKEL